MTEHSLTRRSRFPSARPARCVAVNAAPWLESMPFMRVIAPYEPSFRKQAMRSIRKVINGFALTILLLFAAVTVALLVSCASTTEINGAWVNPEGGKRSQANNVLVIGMNRDTTARQIYEDAIVAQFAAHGIKARPSYKLLLELGQVPPLDIKSEVRNAGVDAVLVSRTVRVSTEIRVTPGHSDGPAVFYRMWSGAFSTAPNVYTVQNVEVETRLFDVKDLALLWSGSSTTNPTSSMQQTINEFATVLIKALADAKVIV
jgi:hypothetical protein